ncbi:glycosyltransferase family 4 protein [Micropruina glycogenica]|uniref:Putative Phosphatidylinositol alpha-mannosyltransferase n=1 Tax=Micropruina glycogenica TaxID=75385 RepID=A0A2N9JC81_9ACTN|nr:glycosyltransferase family 4 protein [Micropruina glycogenica]SPD85139.1 putative Phosphatidylinositol alpha-mannosyltransferase [Micropruina glycogenica]
MTSLIHVPMALSTQGSTLLTVAQSIIDASAPMGIESKAVLSDNRGVSLRSAELHFVDYTRTCPREWFNRRELAVDVAAGFAGLRRPYYGHAYDPAVEAVQGVGGDVVLLYAGHYVAATLPAWSAVRKDSTIVLYCHNPLSRSYGRRELSRLLSAADVVAFCADHLRVDVEERLKGRLPAEFMTVHNGVDPLFTPAIAPTAPNEPFTVVFAGLTTPHKGTHLVLEAVELAARRAQRPIRAQIIGSHSYGHAESISTEYEASLRTYADRMTAPVEFLPFLSKPELSEHLRAASVACLPSQWAEGLPLIALESMACGLPVITSDSVGMIEAVGEAGFVVPGGNPEGMAEAIVILAESEAERTAARDRSLMRSRRFSWANVATAFASLGRDISARG